MQLYEPREDSFLLLKHVKDYAQGNVLDMGTGSGILAAEAKKYARFVLGIDVQESVVDYCKQKYAGVKNLFFKQSDVFSTVDRTFDVIFFNPPYLPTDNLHPDPCLDGGKQGYELIVRFLSAASHVLKPTGKILLLFSSLSKKDKVEEFIGKYGFVFRQLDEQYVGGFETLYVYLIEKSPWLQAVEKKKVTFVSYYAKGKRGIVFQGLLKGKRVAIKITHPASTAVNRIEHEITTLKRLEKEKIAPKVLFTGDDFFVMEFIEGKKIVDFLQAAAKNEICVVLEKLLLMMYRLDQLQITKEEMTRPLKHILVQEDGTVRLLDFERAHISLQPQNVTQFCQFLTTRKMTDMLILKQLHLPREDVVKLTQMYKKDKDKRHLDKIIHKLYE